MNEKKLTKGNKKDGKRKNKQEKNIGFFFFKAKEIGLVNVLGTGFFFLTILIDPIITKKIKISI